MKDKEKIIGSVSLIIGLIIFLLVGYSISKPKKVDTSSMFVEENSKETIKSKKIMVEIKGEVLSPGIFEMNEGDRINDLVNKAGGFSSKADESNIVLVTILKDSDCIRIPAKGEQQNISGASKINLSSSDGKININVATKEQLDTLQGVGPATAEKIIEYREKNNGFKSIEDLKKVGGIGESKFNSLKDKVDIR